MRIKSFVGIVILFISSSLFAKCPTESNAKEAIVFLDLNKNNKEIEVARRAACKRGEYLIVLPKKTGLDYDEEYEMSEGFDNSEIQKSFDWAKNNNIKINSMIISGHDGGGDFGGENGGITKSDLAKIMNNNPHVKDSVSSLLLLGCYTGVKKEIFDWKDMFPNANLIAGYEGQAPLGDKPAGHNYIEGLLAREKELNQAKSKKQIEALLRKGIKNINMISAALYYRPSCESGMDQDTSFYFRPMGGKKGFTEFSSAECEKVKKGEGLKQKEKFLEFYRGERDIPLKTSGTELRQIYNFFRVNEHCFEGDPHFPSAEKVLYTLFFNDVKKNFNQFFEEDGTLNGFRFYLESLNNEFETAFANYIDDNESKYEFLKDRATKFKEPLSEEIKEIQGSVDSLRDELNAKYGIYLPYIKNKKMPEYQSMTDEDKKKFDDYYSNLNYLNSLFDTFEKMDYTETDNDKVPNFVQDHLTRFSKKSEEVLANKDKIKENLKDYLAQVEVPNKEFFDKASREDILKHAHKVEGLVKHEFFGKYGAVNTRYSYRLEEQLVNMRCLPFEWHEYREGVEVPGPACNQDDISSEEDRFLRN